MIRRDNHKRCSCINGYRTIFTDSKRRAKVKQSNKNLFNKFKSFYNDEFKF